jgi:hypothetical protein
MTKFGILLLMMIVKDQIKKSSTEQQLIDQVSFILCWLMFYLNRPYKTS